MLRVVADTNVYISAYAFGGPPSEVLELAQTGAFEIYIAPTILWEIRRTFTRKFHWLENRLDTLIENVLQYTELVNPVENLTVVREDPADDRILECALSAGASFVVTGDRHLLKLKMFSAVTILRPREFLDAQPWQS